MFWNPEGIADGTQIWPKHARGCFSAAGGSGAKRRGRADRLAAATGLHKATAHRLLDQLVGAGVVQRIGGCYRVGSRSGRRCDPSDERERRRACRRFRTGPDRFRNPR
ncbi:helix-turn-helix domain-containing protein [Amycolatopsis circi]|uniref:helix-turn-helix domain-containing protein n=1 Tax=Amycolatopsis circi TaxID=871959 RepID=UPI001FC98E9B|nr:helix-turn-helix domain-containing protein [Amycolatopsis circi]